jgi:alkylhydroperoxidase family enzyme
MMQSGDPGIGFLAAPPTTEAAQRLFDGDIREDGYVSNMSRLWAYQPDALDALFDLMRQVTSARPFTLRERAILVTACAGAYRDSYDSLAWGSRLADEANPKLAADVIGGQTFYLSVPEQALADWALSVAKDPNATRPDDLLALRKAGYGDADIFAMTVFIGLRLAFSTVTSALGVLPDEQFRETAPDAVLEAVTFGRPIVP